MIGTLLPPAVTRDTPILSSLTRPRRVLVVGESILNTDALATNLAGFLPDSVIYRATYGGSESPMGMFALAPAVSARLRTGNRLKYTDLTNAAWRKTNTTVTSATSPTTGDAVYKVTGDGTSGQRIDTYPIYTVAGTTEVTFSLLWEPGTVDNVRLLLYNLTVGGVVKTADFAAGDAIGLPARLQLTATPSEGVGYTVGTDSLRAYIYVGSGGSAPAGDFYVSEVSVVNGRYPAQHVATSGTETAVGSEDWRTPPGGVDRSLFDAIVIQFGRNDTGSLTATEFEAVLEGVVSAAASHANAVMLCTAPPKAASGLGSWEADTDHDAIAAKIVSLASSYGCGAYDAVTDFQARTASSQYTIGDIMRDQDHPTVAGDAFGIKLYAYAIKDFVKRHAINVTSPGNTVRAYIGAEVTSGSWSYQEFTTTNAPLASPLALLAGQQVEGKVQALTSSSAGATIEVPFDGTMVGAVFVNDQTATGEATVRVDGTQVATITDSGGLIYYPKGHFLVDGLAAGGHTLEIEVVSGEVRFMGAVALG